MSGYVWSPSAKMRDLISSILKYFLHAKDPDEPFWERDIANQTVFQFETLLGYNLGTRNFLYILPGFCTGKKDII